MEKGKAAKVLSQKDKELPLNRGETDKAHRQMVIYKVEGGNPMFGF